MSQYRTAQEKQRRAAARYEQRQWREPPAEAPRPVRPTVVPWAWSEFLRYLEVKEWDTRRLWRGLVQAQHPEVQELVQGFRALSARRQPDCLAQLFLTLAPPTRLLQVMERAVAEGVVQRGAVTRLEERVLCKTTHEGRWLPPIETFVVAPFV